MADPDTLNALAAARRIAERLDEDGLPYGIGGALALGAWRAPRSTRDVDLSIFVREPELPRAFDALERAGVMIDREEPGDGSRLHPRLARQDAARRGSAARQL